VEIDGNNKYLKNYYLLILTLILILKMDLFINENVLDKYLNIQINIDDSNNNMLKYEIYGNNSFNIIGIIEKKSKMFPNIFIKIDDNNTLFFIKLTHKTENKDNVYFEFIDITSRTYNNTSNLNISIKDVDVQTSINSENFKKIISTSLGGVNLTDTDSNDDSDDINNNDHTDSSDNENENSHTQLIWSNHSI
jgi:hypothetical protein